MAETDSGSSAGCTPADTRGRRRMYLTLAVMFALFAVVVGYRREIRVHWWGYRLTATTDLAARTQYLELLTTEAARAAPVARELLAADDAATRSFGVALALRVPGDVGEALLQTAVRDADSSIRRGAILGLAVRRSSAVVPTLRGLADDRDLDVAMSAVEGLVTAGSPAALAALSELARTHPQSGVRAQAITSLGEWDAPAAVPVLIDCLADEGVFAGITASERNALDALAQLAPQLAGQAEMPRDIGRTNGERAAVVLRALTGEDFGYLEAEPQARGAAIARWRAWYAAQ